MKRIAFFTYGVLSYFIFFGTFLYFMGFVGNILVPSSLDAPAQSPSSTAILINLILVAIFGLQHSIMARQSFKEWFSRYIPIPIERSTFVLFASAALLLLLTQWQPLGGEIWTIAAGSSAYYGLYALHFFGWILVFASTFAINHFDLFGLRQVYLYLIKKPYMPVRFKTNILYNTVRHPLYLGFVIALWATPTMTISHLAFAVGLTAYILVGIRLEEKDLIKNFGETYKQYAQQVPKLIPIFYLSTRLSTSIGLSFSPTDNSKITRSKAIAKHPPGEVHLGLRAPFPRYLRP